MTRTTVTTNRGSRMARSRKLRQRGSALLLVILLIIVSAIVLGGLVELITSNLKQSFSTRTRESAYSVAEGGINRTVFTMEAGMGDPTNLLDVEGYLTQLLGPGHTGQKDFAGQIADGNYTVTLTDPVAGDQSFRLRAVGKLPSGAGREVSAIVRPAPVSALKYALFGNYIHFDNHNKVNFGVRLVTSIYSNTGVLIDRGISINGTVQAVQFIRPDTGPSSGVLSLPDTVLSPAGQQGDPNPSPIVAAAPVNSVDPPPALQPFPTFDFGGALGEAITAGRNLTAAQFNQLLSNAQTYAQSLTKAGDLNIPMPLPLTSYPSGVSPANVPFAVIHHSGPTHRTIRTPNADQPDLKVDLGSPDGTAPGPNDTYEIIALGNPLPDQDTLIYVSDPLTISLPTDTMLRMEGSLVVNGSLTLHAPVEMLAWENRSAPFFVPLETTLYDFAQNALQVADPTKDIRYSHWPAVAAAGKLDISNSSSGQGGPVHIEGVVFSTAESHLHKSNARERAYSVGSEIADTVHNCEFFSFAYDPEALSTRGLTVRITGRPVLEIVRLEALR